MSRLTFRLLVASSPCRGSSRISSRGALTNALANRHKRCSPDETRRKERSHSSPIPNCSIQYATCSSCFSLQRRYKPTVSNRPEPTMSRQGRFFQVIVVHFGRHVANVLLNVPDAFAPAPLPAKQADIVGV